MSERYEALTLEMMERLVNAAEEIGIQLGRMNDIPHTKPEPDDRVKMEMVDAALDSLLLTKPYVPYRAAVQRAIEAALAAQDTGDTP
jgi:hypothetical protein